jgi:hypothetical protein
MTFKSKNRHNSAHKLLPGLCLILAGALTCVTAVPATRNLAVVTSPASRLDNVALADLAKFCKGTAKAWPDGRNFQLVMHDPDSPEMHLAVQRLFGLMPPDAKQAIAKLNAARPGVMVVRIVENDGDLMSTVAATPGAIGVLDVYSITSAVKVLRVDGKLPFDPGYALKGN